jgi:DNA polymerase-1
MASQGVKTYKDFESHMKTVESKFWDRFPGVKEWQERTLAFHKTNGYIENLFGYRMRGAMTKNQIVNGPIQGAAFQVLLWCLIEINRVRKDEGWKSQLLGQIHDSIVASVHPDEERHVILTMHHIMTEDIRDRFPWVCVPLEAEPEITEIDASWYEKKEVPIQYYLDDANWHEE